MIQAAAALCLPLLAAPAVAAGLFGAPVLVKSEGAAARAETAGTTARLVFESQGAGEASAWLEWPVTQPASAAVLALKCTYAATGASGLSGVACELADADGGAWRAGMAAPLTGSAWDRARFPLARFTRAGTVAVLTGERVTRVRLGFQCRGRARGELLVRELAFTTEPNQPKVPLTLGRGTGGEGAWSASGAPHSPTTLELSETAGPEATPAAVVRFEFSAGKYNYHWAAVETGPADTSGYAAVRVTYRTETPDGFPPLNVMLRERDGGAYWVPEALPLSPGRFSTATVPFSRFTVPGWSKDANGRLDVDRIAQVALGFATGSSGSGKIVISDVVLVPQGW